MRSGAAENIADYSIRLPTDVTEIVGKRLDRLRLLTYVIAVDESARARSQREAILATARQQMAQEIQNRTKASDSQQAHIESLRAEADQQKAALIADAANQTEAARDSAEKRIGSCSSENIRKVVSWGIKVGLVLCSLPALALLMMVILSARENKTNVVLFGFLCCFVPPTLIALLVSLPMGLWAWLANYDRDQKLEAIDEARLSGVQNLRRKLATKLVRLETRLSEAKAREKKARAALAVLK